MNSNRVLVVDDEELMRWFLRERLTQAGYHVTLAESGAAALHHLRDGSHGVGAIILDYRLPDLNGVEVLRRAKELLPECPVILMSAYGTTDIKDEAEELGASGVLEKPFEMDDLLAMLRAL